MNISPVTNYYKPVSVSKYMQKNEPHKSECFNCAKLSSENYKAAFLPSFGSLKYREGENNFCDTSFFRDVETLDKAASILRKKFPKGTDILDFACSNGEEAISLHAILNNKNKGKYKIYCFDKSKNIIDIANKGVYTVYNGPSSDGYLISPFVLHDKKYKELVNAFNEIMEETGKPDYPINDENFLKFISQMYEDEFKIKHFKIRDKYKDNFQFNVGDINDIDKLFPDKKAGAILFRNAFYIPTHNLALNEFQSDIRTDINKQEIIDKIVDKVYDKLLPGGLFILGDNEKDHVFISDECLTDAETLFVPSYFATIYKQPPVYKALTREHRFSPVHKKMINCAMGKMEIFTVWQKNK